MSYPLSKLFLKNQGSLFFSYIEPIPSTIIRTLQLKMGKSFKNKQSSNSSIVQINSSYVSGNVVSGNLKTGRTKVTYDDSSSSSDDESHSRSIYVEKGSKIKGGIFTGDNIISNNVVYTSFKKKKHLSTAEKQLKQRLADQKKYTQKLTHHQQRVSYYTRQLQTVTTNIQDLETEPKSVEAGNI